MLDDAKMLITISHHEEVFQYGEACATTNAPCGRYQAGVKRARNSFAANPLFFTPDFWKPTQLTRVESSVDRWVEKHARRILASTSTAIVCLSSQYNKEGLRIPPEIIRHAVLERNSRWDDEVTWQELEF